MRGNILYLIQFFLHQVPRLKNLWLDLPIITRISFTLCLAIIFSLLGVISLRHWQRIKPAELPITTQIIATPPIEKPIALPTKIVIDSVDQATLADAVDDDTVVTTNRSISEWEMVRVANDWLAPQVIQLDTQLVGLRSSVVRAKKVIAEQEPLLSPLRADLEAAEREYKRITAALDLPTLPNSNSFNQDLEYRFKEIRTRRDNLRKQLQSIEQNVSNAQKRLATDEPALAQLEVEAVNTRERLEKVRTRDTKILAITYQYAISGLRILPLLRFLGRSNWSISFVSDISRDFEQQFRHPLPISAYGQSKTHDRLGWDHSQAVDVALHPASQEGTWLTSYLHRNNISFMAFRTAVPGIATGPHVHIGAPSQRLYKR